MGRRCETAAESFVLDPGMPESRSPIFRAHLSIAVDRVESIPMRMDGRHIFGFSAFSVFVVVVHDKKSDGEKILDSSTV